MTFHPAVFGAVGIGALVGAAMAARVGMTQMPELVARARHLMLGCDDVAAPRLGLAGAVSIAGLPRRTRSIALVARCRCMATVVRRHAALALRRTMVTCG
jgi:NAD/NADP transhydrogenase beta subunit